MNNTPALSTFPSPVTAPIKPVTAPKAPARRKALSHAAAPHVVAPRTSLTRPQLMRLFSAWRRDCQIGQHSERTLDSCRKTFDKLVWYLDRVGEGTCGTEQIRGFLAYLTTAHQHIEGGEGRWGNQVALRTSAGKPLKPLTVQTYFGHLRAFFNWIVAQGELDTSPMAAIKLPGNRPDQIQPFSQQHIDALLSAARHGTHPRRDEALVLLLLDTGLRVSELCSLSLSDIDTTMKSLRVEGKGGKERSLYFGKTTARALWAYKAEPHKQALSAHAPLFAADRGEGAGQRLTDSGVRQLIERLARAGGVSGVRVSPHTFRHTFAVSFLRGGGNTLALQQLMGHTTITQTMKYVKLVEGDLEQQHRLYSPVDRMKKGR